MKRETLHIKEPCSADWEQMSGDDQKRFCSLCTKHVHDVSQLTEQEATTLLATQSNLCVQYAHSDEGEIFFKDSEDVRWRLFRQAQGIKRLLAAAALVLPLSLAACEQPADTPSAVADAPLEIGKDGVKIQGVGAGRAPAFKSLPADDTPHHEEVELVKGQMPSHEAEPEDQIHVLRGEPPVYEEQGEDEASCDDPSEADKAQEKEQATRAASEPRIRRTLGKPMRRGNTEAHGGEESKPHPLDSIVIK